MFYEVILKDTIMFPGGGGQPCDSGILNGIPVVRVTRENGQAVHLLTSPVKPKSDAVLILHWARRFDHMQQHTAQHLISALAEKVFKLQTMSWNLGTTENYIELDSPDVNVYKMEQLEQMVNEVIRSCVPVTVAYYEKGDVALSQVRTRLELPEYHDGQIRVVTIQGVDSNTCCGTHVKNTSELQAIKLMYTEKGKRNRTNLYFIAGDRVLGFARRSVFRDRKLTQLLGCNSEEHHICIERLQNSVKAANKVAQTALRDVARLEAKCFNLQEPKPNFFSLHRTDAEMDFISVFLGEVKSDETLFFLTVGDPKGGGHMVLSGPLQAVDTYGPQVCKILEGKGAVNNAKFQGKVKKLCNVPEAEKLLKDVFG